MRALDALRRVVALAPAVLSVCAAQLAILALWLSPFALVLGVSYVWLLSSHDINYYLTQRPPEFQLAMVILAFAAFASALVIAHLFARFAFALHFCLVRGRHVLLCAQAQRNADSRGALARRKNACRLDSRGRPFFQCLDGTVHMACRDARRCAAAAAWFTGRPWSDLRSIVLTILGDRFGDGRYDRLRAHRDALFLQIARGAWLGTVVRRPRCCPPGSALARSALVASAALAMDGRCDNTLRFDRDLAARHGAA